MVVDYFVKDRYFYQTFFSLLFMLALQNLISFGVNLADNLMIGAYSEAALSGWLHMYDGTYVVLL